MSKEKPTHIDPPIKWGIAATLGYILFFFGFYRWIGKPLEQISLNETGDFLAGLFAPLAFVWLVVAVFLQRSELQAQRRTLEQQMAELQLSREELKLNRRELELNRAAIGEQSVELKKQSEVLDKQAKRLHDNSRLVEIDAQLERILTDLALAIDQFRWKNHPGSTIIEKRHGYGVPPIPKMLENDQFAEACRQAAKDLEFILGRRETLVVLADVGNFITEVKDVFDEVHSSSSFTGYFVNYELSKLIGALESVSKLKLPN